MADRWVEDLMDTISGCWEWHSLALRIGFFCRKPEGKDDCWEVWAFPSLQEMVGGEHDGETVWSGFNFNLSDLLEQLKAEHVRICTRMHGQPPEVALEGKFQGKAILLHLCLEPPENVEASEILDLTQPGNAQIREKENGLCLFPRHNLLLKREVPEVTERYPSIYHFILARLVYSGHPFAAQVPA